MRRPGSLRVETLDGRLLVVTRVKGDGGDRLEPPIYRTYLLAAALEPVELADGDDGAGERSGAPLLFGALTEVVSQGRPAWEAVVRPTAAYDPLCSCCPLLPSEVADSREASTGGVPVRQRLADFTYPTSHRIRLDAETGVCVFTEALGGTADGSGHELVIESVDEPMDEALFRARRRWGKALGTTAPQRSRRSRST